VSRAGDHDERDARPVPGGGNQGVYISGGTVYGPVASAGYQGRVVQVSHGGSGGDDRGRLEDLLEQLAEGLAGLGTPGAEGAIDDVERVQGELDHPRPDKSRIGQLMDRITAAIGTASGLLTVASQARVLIEAILH
jgi:hypothetical protein